MSSRVFVGVVERLRRSAKSLDDGGDPLVARDDMVWAAQEIENWFLDQMASAYPGDIDGSIRALMGKTK